MISNKWQPVISKETGTVYFIISEVMNCTDNYKMILFENTEGTLFCRSEDEFYSLYDLIINYKIEKI